MEYMAARMDDVITGGISEREYMMAELTTLRAENEWLREALEGVYACHGSNPSYAMADMPDIDYIKYTLMTARRIAKEALK